MCVELTEIKDIALTLAAFSSIYVGIAGLSAWKRQLQGNTEYVLAKGVLTALYELRGAIDLARNGFQSYYPDLPAEELNKLDPKEKQWLIISNGYRKRWDAITLADAKFKSCLIEVEVVWLFLTLWVSTIPNVVLAFRPSALRQAATCSYKGFSSKL